MTILGLIEMVKKPKPHAPGYRLKICKAPTPCFVCGYSIPLDSLSVLHRLGTFCLNCGLTAIYTRKGGPLEDIAF